MGKEQLRKLGNVLAAAVASIVIAALLTIFGPVAAVPTQPVPHAGALKHFGFSALPAGFSETDEQHKQKSWSLAFERRGGSQLALELWELDADSGQSVLSAQELDQAAKLMSSKLASQDTCSFGDQSVIELDARKASVQRLTCPKFNRNVFAVNGLHGMTLVSADVPGEFTGADRQTVAAILHEISSPAAKAYR